MKTIHKSSYQLDDITYKVELVNDSGRFKVLIDDNVVYQFTSLDQAEKCFKLVIMHAGNYTKVFDGLQN